jgi:alpha-glucosidase
MSISGMGLLALISVDSQNNLQVIYMRGGFNCVFILSRTHSSGDHGDQEPWAFDEDIIDITRKFVNLRYQLLPYLYTMFWQYIEEGIPMLKPLVYYDQSDIQTHYRNDEFILETKF